LILDLTTNGTTLSLDGGIGNTIPLFWVASTEDETVLLTGSQPVFNRGFSTGLTQNGKLGYGFIQKNCGRYPFSALLAILTVLSGYNADGLFKDNWRRTGHGQEYAQGQQSQSWETSR
jgi:hypothetical protein